MLNIAIVPNMQKDTDLLTTKKICNLLSGRANVFLCDRLITRDLAATFVSEDFLYTKTDIIFALGGDGTLLHTAIKACYANIPVLGINLGHLGFLAQAEKNHIEECIEKILDGSYAIEKRMMINAKIFKSDKLIKSIDVLNDVVISRFTFSSLIDIQLIVDHSEAEKYLADGLIIATPTGSTAYSLSANGPIVDPCVDAIISTPVCAHNLNSRSIVIPSHKTIMLKLLPSRAADAIVRFDGAGGYSIDSTCATIITKSNFHASLIRTNNSNFYDVLREKLSY